MSPTSWTIGAIELACIGIVALIFARWMLRQILLASLGVKSKAGLPPGPVDRMLRRYEALSTSVWMFAWFKVRLDPMFRELPQLLEAMPAPRTILDIGCGYGFAGGALLEWFPNARITGIDPIPRRVGIASKIFAERGQAIRAAAPDLPMAQFPDRADALFILDVIHCLNDSELESTLHRLRERADRGHWLIIRTSIPEAPAKSLLFRLEAVERFFTRMHVYYRTAESVEQMLQTCGFILRNKQMSGERGELCWFIATAS